MACGSRCMIGPMAHPDVPPRIARLPPELANQIAAGEVVERPASVVKELVENSLDAGADRVQIQIQRGGIESIRVSDNGHGIHPDDLTLALERHATSKIRTASDLAGISSLGFRGEALPSIAAVASFTLTSRARGEDTGFRVESGPRLGAARRSPAPHPPGTTVEVRGLFHGLPARRKFLRSERTEYLHVLEMVKRLALSRASVGVRFSHNGKIVLQCAGGDPAWHPRVETILGRAFSSRALNLDCARAGMRLRGWLGRADASRSQSDLQYVYLNGRMIRDRQVSHAVRLAYRELVPEGRHPSYLLYLEMDAAGADVNVHPTKHEVRFRRARDVHDFIAAAVRDALGEERHRNAAPLEAADAPGTRDAYSYPEVRDPGAYHDRPRAPEGAAEQPAPELGRPLGHLQARYIFTERRGSFVVIDAQRAMQLRLRMRISRDRTAGPLKMRPLLVPVDIPATAEEMDAAERCSDVLAGLGLELGPVAPGRLRIRQIPVLLEDADVPALVKDLLRIPGPTGDPAGIEERLVETLIAHAPAPLAQDRSLQRLSAFLLSLEDLGLQLGAASCAGIWRTLAPDDLDALLRGRG